MLCISNTHRSLQPLKAVATATFKSLLRQRITPFMLVLGGLFMGLGLLLSSVDLGVRYRLFENILLSAQIFLLHALAWLYLFEVLRQEQALNLCVLPLSAGIPRAHYYAAKFLGVLGIVLLYGLFFVLVDALLMWLIEGQWRVPVLLQVSLFVVSAVLAMALLWFFAAFVSPINAVIYSILLWFIGHGLDELWIVVSQQLGGLAMFVVTAGYYLLPNFSFFDLMSLTVNQQPMAWAAYFFGVFYGLGYSLILVGFANYLYGKKAVFPVASV